MKKIVFKLSLLYLFIFLFCSKIYSYERELIITPCDEQQVKDNCESFGYVYTVIKPTDIVYPPSDSD